MIGNQEVDDVLFNFHKRRDEMIKWSFKTALSKIIRRGLTPLFAFLFSPKAIELLTQMGIIIDQDKLNLFLTGLIVYLVTELGRNWFKTKTGARWL